MLVNGTEINFERGVLEFFKEAEIASDIPLQSFIETSLSLLIDAISI
jgi:hypothetical protein